MKTMNLVTRRRVLLAPAAAVLSRPALLGAQDLREPREKHRIWLEPEYLKHVEA